MLPLVPYHRQPTFFQTARDVPVRRRAQRRMLAGAEIKRQVLPGPGPQGGVRSRAAQAVGAELDRALRQQGDFLAQVRNPEEEVPGRFGGNRLAHLGETLFGQASHAFSHRQRGLAIRRWRTPDRTRRVSPDLAHAHAQIAHDQRAFAPHVIDEHGETADLAVAADHVAAIGAEPVRRISEFNVHFDGAGRQAMYG